MIETLGIMDIMGRTSTFDCIGSIAMAHCITGVIVHFLPIELSVQMRPDIVFGKKASRESWAQSIVASGNKEGPRVGNLRLKCRK